MIETAVFDTKAYDREYLARARCWWSARAGKAGSFSTR